MEITATSQYLGTTNERYPMDRWDVTLTCEGRSETFSYRSGTGNRALHYPNTVKPKGAVDLGRLNWRDVPRHSPLRKDPHADRLHLWAVPPTVKDIMYSLVLDVSSVEESRDWTDWAEEFGMLDGTGKAARTAQATYAACRDEGDKLRRLLGSNYREAMDTEWDA